jgi:hypothetical protein
MDKISCLSLNDCKEYDNVSSLQYYALQQFHRLLFIDLLLVIVEFIALLFGFTFFHKGNEHFRTLVQAG